MALSSHQATHLCELCVPVWWVDAPVIAQASVNSGPNKSVTIIAIDHRQLGSIHPSRQSPAASRPSQPGSFPGPSHIWSLDVCVRVYFGLFSALDQTPVSQDHAPFAAFVLELSFVRRVKLRVQPQTRTRLAEARSALLIYRASSVRSNKWMCLFRVFANVLRGFPWVTQGPYCKLLFTSTGLSSSLAGHGASQCGTTQREVT